MATLREIKKRMTAVGSIARITKTMQMIANAKFAAAVQRAKATKPYTQKIRQLVAEVAAAAGDVQHPLIDGPAESPRKELLLVVSSDRGLCGAYNSNILRKATAHVRATRSAGTEIDIEVAGKKALAAVKYHRYAVAERHTFGDKPKYEDIKIVASLASGDAFWDWLDLFVQGKGTRKTGATCTTHSECDSVHGAPACLENPGGVANFPGGYCSEFCEETPACAGSGALGAICFIPGSAQSICGGSPESPGLIQ